jgi:hypothetical protein
MENTLPVLDLRDHGISEWICFTSATVTYASPYSGNTIYQITPSGAVTTVVASANYTSSGTFSATAGNRYFATKGTHFMVQDGGSQHVMVPTTFKGKYFFHYFSRYSPTTFYFYAVDENVTIYYYEGGTGVSGTPVSSFSLSKGNTTTFQSSTISTYLFFEATGNIVMSSKGTNTATFTDATIVGPADYYYYNYFNESARTIYNGTPTIATGVAYSSDLVGAMSIADAAGGDNETGVGLSYLSDRYAWSNALSDFVLICPYANTTVNVYYYSGGWVLGGSYSMNGTLTAPSVIVRDGTNGFTTAGSTTSGTASYFASGATFWKFEGTNPFAVRINDTSDDEEFLLGWMASKSQR